jgi:hypothetical protein
MHIITKFSFKINAVAIHYFVTVHKDVKSYQRNKQTKKQTKQKMILFVCIIEEGLASSVSFSTSFHLTFLSSRQGTTVGQFHQCHFIGQLLSTKHKKRLNFWDLVSISSTFYACLFCTKVFLAAFLHLHVSRKKLLEALLYEKWARKMLMKLTPVIA